ncbi:MAG TPA: hypothetical protein VE136_15905 [Anaerolineales bacterium]|nr:hypothetical protein [Anaerolineales bacterium]
MMMGFGLILLLSLIGLLVYALGVRPQFNQAGPAQTSQDPAEILKARYATGEIRRDL